MRDLNKFIKNNNIILPEPVKFEFGKKTIAIQVKNLHLKKKQIILYADDGIPQINTTEIYNVDSIAGVYLEVELYI